MTSSINSTNKIRDTFYNFNTSNAVIGTVTGIASSGSNRLICGSNGGAATIGTSGDGGILTIQGGYAGTCSGAGTGGNGGNVILTPGNGGSTVGGTDGANGLVKFNSTCIKPISITNNSTAITYTITQLRGGIIYRTPGGNVNDILPTAANAVAGLPGVTIGDGLIFSIINNTAGSTITLTINTGVTIAGQASHSIIQAATSGKFMIIFTNVSVGTEAFTVYRL